MRDYFDSDAQKNRCLDALDDAIRIWNKMKPGDTDKESAIRQLKKTGRLPSCCEFENDCPLCQYAKDETDRHAENHYHRDALYDEYESGFCCDLYCPVIWDKENNPENEDRGEVPCQHDASPYETWRNAIFEEDRSEEPMEHILENMRTILSETRKQVQDLPVRKGGTP